MSGDPLNRPRSFESTRWSLVAQVRSADPQERKLALEQLLATYYSALQIHLVARMRLEPSRADDLLQSFVVKKIIERDLMGRADPTKGRLRSLLLKSLENFVRTELGRDRSPLSLGDDSHSPATPTADLPADVFDVAWARGVLVEALCRMRSACQQTERMHIWTLLETRVIGPALGRPNVSYDELVKRLGLRSPQEASNTLMTAKRQFQRTLRAVVAESVEGEGEIDREIADLGEILAAAAPIGSSILPPSAPRPVDQETGAILSAIDESSPAVLARLMATRADGEVLWDEADLSALVEHQLSIPLNQVFAGFDRQRGGSSAKLPSFGALLETPQPPIEVLIDVKRAARAATNEESVSLSNQIATLLYFASIALALVKCGERITKSDDTVLRYGFQKMLDQDWLGQPLRQLFVESLAHASRSPNPADEAG